MKQQQPTLFTSTLLKSIMVEDGSRVALVAQTFTALDSDCRKRALEQILSSCTFGELIYAREKLFRVLGGDITFLFPPEILTHIFSFLDDLTLGRCCLVSHKWNRFISGCDSLWYRLCLKYCIKVPCGAAELSMKACFGRGRWILEHLKLEPAFHVFEIDWNITRKSRTVCIAANESHGIIVTASDNRELSLIDIKSYQCVSVQLVVAQVSCILVKSQKIFTGHFDGTVCEYSIDFVLRKVHQGHTGAVYAVDYSPVFNYIVSGASDESIKIWTDKKYPFASCSVHDQWITEVLIMEDNFKVEKNETSLLIASKSKHHLILLEFLVNSASFVPLWKVDYESNQCSAGLAYSDGFIIIAHEEGVMLFYKTNSNDCTRCLQLGCRINGILACGKSFILIMLDDFSCHVYNVATGLLVTKWTNPDWGYNSRLCNVICLGLQWLNGIDTLQSENFSFLYATKHNGIKLKQLTLESLSST